MRIKGCFGLSLLYILSLMGCTKENLSDCVPLRGGVILKYDYWLNMDYANLFGTKVADLKVFIFDRDSILCDTLSPAVVAGELNNDWSRQIVLDPGTYTFVTWAGDFLGSDIFSFTASNTDMPEQGVVIGETRLRDLKAGLKFLVASGSQNQMLPRLFYGIQSGIDVKSGVLTTVVTSLIRDTKKVSVKITGLDALKQPSVDELDFDVSLTACNGRYGYNNLADLLAPLLIYEPSLKTLDNDTVKTDISTLRLLRFARGDGYISPLLNVIYKPTNRKLCENLDVTDLILSAKIPARDSDGRVIKGADGQLEMVYPTSEYLDRQDLFEILIELEDINGHLGFTVQVNGWTIKNIIPQS